MAAASRCVCVVVVFSRRDATLEDVGLREDSAKNGTDMRCSPSKFLFVKSTPRIPTRYRTLFKVRFADLICEFLRLFNGVAFTRRYKSLVRFRDAKRNAGSIFFFRREGDLWSV